MSGPQTFLTPLLLLVTSRDDSSPSLFTALTSYIILPTRRCHVSRLEPNLGDAPTFPHLGPTKRYRFLFEGREVLAGQESTNTPPSTGFACFSLHSILKRIITKRGGCSSEATSPTHDCSQNSSSGIKASVWISPHPSLYCMLLYNVTVDAYPSQCQRIKRSLLRRGGLSLRV